MKKKIFFCNKIIGEIIYRKKDTKINNIIKVIEANYPQLREFFGFTIPQFKIILLYSRSEMNKLFGNKTPVWLCGFVKKRNIIYMLSPLVSKKVSIHSEKDIHKVIIHEIVHLFIKRINKNPLTWVNEGIASFLAKQDKSRDFKKSDWQFFVSEVFTKNIDYRVFAQYKGYNISYWLTKTISKKFDNNKLRDLIKFNPKKDNKKKLEKILGISIGDFLKTLNSKE